MPKRNLLLQGGVLQAPEAQRVCRQHPKHVSGLGHWQGSGANSTCSHKAPTITTHGCIPLCSAPASPWDPVQSQWLQPTNSCRAACPGQHPLRLTTQCSATALLNVCHCCHSVVPDCTAVEQQHWQLPLTRAKASSVVHKAVANILFPLCIFIQPFSFYGPYSDPGPEFWTGWGLCRHDLTPFDPTATGVTLIVLLVVLLSAYLSSIVGTLSEQQLQQQIELQPGLAHCNWCSCCTLSISQQHPIEPACEPSTMQCPMLVLVVN